MDEERIPHSVEAEQSILGACLLDSGVIPKLESRINIDAFYSESCRAVYSAVRGLYADNKPIDVLTVAEALRCREPPEDTSWGKYIQDLQWTTPSVANVDYYIDIVEKAYMSRKLLEVADALKAHVLEGRHAPTGIAAAAEKKLLQITSKQEQRTLTPLKDILIKVMGDVERQSQQHSIVSGVPTGYFQLDKMLGGLQGGDLVLIAARPSMGKTSLALNMASNMSSIYGKRVAFFSLEMEKEALAKKYLSAEAIVPGPKIKAGDIDGADSAIMWETVGRAAEFDFDVDDTPAMTVSEVRSKTKIKQQVSGIDVIFIDYLQLMRPERRTSSREEDVSEISMGLKRLAKELKIPIVAMAQLNRTAESREGHRPMLSDLRESGSLEQDADVVMFLYRDGYYLREKAMDDGLTELMISKQRNGEVGSVWLQFMPELTRFVQVHHIIKPAYTESDTDKKQYRKRKE